MSRQVVVSDSSVLVDLERGDLFVPAFSLQLEFCVPDLLYEQELRQYGGERLIALGLSVHELDAEGISQAVRYRNAASSLSLPDAFALSLAQRTGSTLLTGDARLRKIASREGVNCHGVLWLLNRMHKERTAATRQSRVHPRPSTL